MQFNFVHIYIIYYAMTIIIGFLKSLKLIHVVFNTYEVHASELHFLNHIPLLNS